MLRRLVALAFWLGVFPLLAADPPKPNTLTPREIADGWLLLFDGETTFGWKVEEEAKVADGVLKVGGDKPAAVTTTTAFGACEILFEYLLEGKDAGKAEFLFEGTRPLRGSPTEWSRGHIVRDASTFQMSFQVLGSDKGYGEAAKDPKPPRRTAFGFKVPANAKLSLRNVKLKPLETKSLFNGTDLTGWKEHPGKKSKFSVENGTIRIQNGPGDLQSEGQWDDFVLQLECKTNGKHLNSGVFFRCRPGEYQQGYEAQIHNGFGDKPKEYTIEEFDPATGKPTDKKKVKYAAMDYGTGAIYRRIPARKQLAKDNEWFTMTVIAAGRHIATWVNGVQTVDWTDNRPLKDNARNGCWLEKGPISFQGHDPTTDLNFRNIRIGELKK